MTDIQLNSIDGVVFDLDDTLHTGNKEELKTRLIIASSQMGLSCTEEDIELACEQSDFERMYPFLVRSYTGTEEMTYEKVREHNSKFSGKFDYMFRLCDGAIEVLDYLKEKGKKMAIVTSRSRRSAKRLTDLHGITDYFVTIIGRDNHPKAKPHPGPINMALEGMGVTPDRAMYVGDLQVDDIGGAIAAGIKYRVLVNEEIDMGKPRPTHSFNSLNDMHSILKKINDKK